MRTRIQGSKVDWVVCERGIGIDWISNTADVAAVAIPVVIKMPADYNGKPFGHVVSFEY